MLPKLARLHEEKDFARVLRYGKTLSQGVLVWRITPNNLPRTRVGIVIANSVIKKATGRNRAKRLIRAVLLKHYKNFRPGRDIAILGRKGIEQETFATLSVLIPGALRTMNML